jgi:mono/diheme cytochrome c family protein
MKRWLVVTLSVSAVAACSPQSTADTEDTLTQNEIFQRMQRQPKYLPYQASRFFADGRAMRTPPSGTVSREAWSMGQRYPHGVNPDMSFVEHVPIEVDLATLELGRKNFDIVCAACHGLAGDGQSIVATKMSMAPPPSFHSPKLRNKSDGYFYMVIDQGYGVMPAFGWRLNPRENWAVVAYIRALQYSQFAPLAEAPPDVRAQLQEAR